jgi:TRAP-type C4-dicarboxylate transport system substrate-binding protein
MKRMLDFVAEEGGEIIEFSPEERAKMQELAKPIWETSISQVEEKGLPGRDILEEILKFTSESQST